MNCFLNIAKRFQNGRRAGPLQKRTSQSDNRIQKGRAKSTIKIYAGYLWALGGELIRKINEVEDERKLSAKQLILKHISESGGPYWRHARDGLDHEKYDSVCKGLYKFMTNQS
jgi:hypothetical protein